MAWKGDKSVLIPFLFFPPVFRALVRPGRFDRVIAVPLPDVRGRTQILQHHMKEVVTATGQGHWVIYVIARF
jgi:hypothetical protein